MTVDTMSENSSLSKRFLTSKAPYSKPYIHLPRFSDKNIEQVLLTLCFLEPHSSTFCIIKPDQELLQHNIKYF